MWSKLLPQWWLEKKESSHKLAMSTVQGIAKGPEWLWCISPERLELKILLNLYRREKKAADRKTECLSCDFHGKPPLAPWFFKNLISEAFLFLFLPGLNAKEVSLEISLAESLGGEYMAVRWKVMSLFSVTEQTGLWHEKSNGEQWEFHELFPRLPF